MGYLDYQEFQSTLPQGERLVYQTTSSQLHLFQSTLPQGERRVIRNGGGVAAKISIHAPARGATPSDFIGPGVSKISIHAPARGATLIKEPVTIGINDFNPRSRKGSDRRIAVAVNPFQHFNPRSRKGSDRNYNQISQLTFIQNYLFTYVIFSLLLTPSPSSKHSSIFCAIFPVRIPRIFYVYFRFAPAYKINI